MTKDEKRLEDFLDDAEIISHYSSRQAVEDGVLFDVQELAKLAPSITWDQGPFQYVTSNLAYSKGYLRDGEEVSVPNFLDLFRTAATYMECHEPSTAYTIPVEFPDGSKGEVLAHLNEHGRYTLMLGEDE